MKRIIFILTGLALFFITNAQTKNFIDQPYIDVTGSADTLVTPNEIFIHILISERDTKGRTSVEELQKKMISALEGLGIDVEKNLKTSDMISEFKNYFLRRKEILKSKQFTLKVGNAETAGKVFVALEDMGISNTSIERVDHSEIDLIRNHIRSKAVGNAKLRAEALTGPLHQEIGAAIFIADQEPYPVRSNLLSGKVAGLVIRGYGTLDKLSEETRKIEFEKIKVSANIQVKFILEMS